MKKLSKQDRISLVLGTYPYYSIMSDPLVEKCGYWTGGFVDKWTWRPKEVENLSEQELEELYEKCKNSWQ